MLILVLAAALTFDAMSEEELKQTGLSKLSLEERVQLREWIEDHCSKKVVVQNKTARPVLQEVLKGGKYVRLSDHSLWEIDPQDTPITQSWITVTEIKAKESGNQEYPYTLTNNLTGSVVKARRVQKVS